MKIEITKIAKKQLKKLPKNIQEKARKTFLLLSDNPQYPGLNSKKKTGSDLFEGRVDYHYRVTYEVKEDTIYIWNIGMHDKGLGKK